jgi:hypothetical protein
VIQAKRPIAPVAAVLRVAEKSRCDLGQQNLKDVQHERIYQLAVDGDQSFPPLKTHAPKSASDELGERIERHVLEMVD